MFALVEYTCMRLRESAPEPSGASAPVTMVDVAKHLLNLLSAVKQLPGWLHLDRFINDTDAYLESISIVLGRKSVAIGSDRKSCAIDELMAKGSALVKRLFMRVNWVLHLQTQEQKRTDPEVYMRVISADGGWAADANAFMKEAEVKVTAMVENQQKFHDFRELQRKGVEWPHSKDLRIDIEAAGFTYRPMMIKRDRCICGTCHVEVSGWMIWHNPWAFHDYTKHHVKKLPPTHNAEKN